MKTAFAVGVPLATIFLIRFWGPSVFRALAICFALTAAVSLAAGLGLALWRMVQGWAYERFTQGR